MEAKELRIGNWYQWYSEGKYYNFQVEDRDFVSNNIKNFKPIRLTEEWLLKFGFENSYRSDFTITMQHVTNDKFGIKINVSTGMSLVYLGIPIKIEFVHQLQNIPFALTGKELTLNTMEVKPKVKKGFPIKFRERSRDNPDKWVLIDANTSDEALSIWISNNPNNHYVGMIHEKISEEDLPSRIEKSNKLWNSFLL